MKRISLVIIFMVGVCLNHAFAQNVAKVQEPEFIGVFWYLEPQTGNLTALERQTPETKFKVKALGFGGAESNIRISGEQSPIRFKSNQSLQFVVRVSSQQTDPVSIIQFFRFEPKKGMRQLQMMKVGSMGVGSKSTMNSNAISFNAAKYGDSSFRVVPANALLPGEYCLSGPGSADGFCFGVDAATDIK